MFEAFTSEFHAERIPIPSRLQINKLKPHLILFMRHAQSFECQYRTACYLQISRLCALDSDDDLYTQLVKHPKVDVESLISTEYSMSE